MWDCLNYHELLNWYPVAEKETETRVRKVMGKARMLIVCTHNQCLVKYTANQDYETIISVDNSPEEVFKAINNVRGWWDGEIDGVTDKLDGVFTYKYETFHNSKQKITALVPNKKVVWSVTEGGPKFTKNKVEWKGTEIVFEVSKKGDKTEIKFTHKGLIPRLECYDSCSNAWGFIISDSLRSFIATGKGKQL